MTDAVPTRFCTDTVAALRRPDRPDPLGVLPNGIITPHSSAQTAATGAGAVRIILTDPARNGRSASLVDER